MQKRIAKMQALGQKVTVYNIKMHYSLTCSAETIKERVFKAMGQKWLRRSHKPGVPAGCTEDCRGSVSSIDELRSSFESHFSTRNHCKTRSRTPFLRGGSLSG